MSDAIAEPFIDWLEDDQKVVTDGAITYFYDLTQGSDEWLEARRGLLTASEMSLALTPTLKIANNDKVRTHVYELAAQRISKYVEPHFVSDDMLRGIEDEFDAKMIYHKEVAMLRDVGFITNKKWGFTLGYSPDALVGNDGLIEVKSRRQKYQVQTIAEHVATGSATIPTAYVLQCQTGLMVAEREWLDFISYCGGMPMCVIRVYPDEEIQRAILEAAQGFEEKVQAAIAMFHNAEAAEGAVLFPTERKEREEITL